MTPRRQKYRARPIRDDIIVVRVSDRRYRLAQQTKNGEGYTNFGGGEIGLTNIREYEFISEPVSFVQLHKLLPEYAGEAIDLEM